MIILPIYNTTKTYEIHPSKIIALGLNYLEHIKESQEIALNLDIDPDKAKNSIPSEPHIFPKTPNVLIGPEETVIIPKIAYQYNFDTVRTDLEAELAIIIKNRCKNVPKEKAMDFIFGFTCMNDVSQRNIQKSDKTGWFRGKSFDTFGPIGPQIVLTKDIGNAQDLKIQSRLNGQLCQDSNTKMMIFDIPTIIEFVSRNFTLEEGDIIITGTPKGVAQLSEGDIMEIEIEKIGILRNSVKLEQ